METAISFGTDGWRATLDEFTAPRVRMVGQAVVDYLDGAGLGDDPVVVGYDARETSEGFAKELARVLAAGGHDVIVPERDRPTPLVAWAIVDRDLAGGLMITASHNPPEYNGVKFIPEDGAPALPEVTDRIMENLREPDPLPEERHGNVRRVDLVESHAEQAMDLVGADLSELSVAYDAMHGSGRGTTDALLERAGATVERRRCERDPEFGGVSPEPSAENLEGLVDAVESGDADLGIANDGDSDRIAVVTPERGFLDENLLFAALYDYLLEEQSGPAVRSVSTTFLIDEIAEANGEEVVETPVGFKWVAQAMAERDALIGGEESGGFTIRGHVREKDGVLTALLAAAAESEESIDERVDRLLDAHGDIVPGKISVDCPDDQKAAAMAAIEDALPDELAGRAVAETSTVDGVKLLLDDGSWVLVRPSGTEPKLRVYAEAESTEAVDALLADGRELVEANV
ncbi:phosphoglucomutase/phosphomannomutase family protein [Natronoarchaeum mannanilyticum]|uniref:Phosphoglucomutase/phosphomannomutase family protein n=1 Tax=Natronoarchaeum mannanilyticum TaxID=926360 RepID=A0AAV3T838_9EURY